MAVFSRNTLNRFVAALTSRGAATEFFNTYNVTTKGTAEASKAVVLDASKGIGTITTATITTLTTGAAGGRVGSLVYSNTAASTTIGNTGAAETLFDLSYTIPANTLAAGTKVRIRYAGFGVTGIGSDTFASKLYIGGSSGGTALITAATTALATNGTFTGECELIQRSTGATGAFYSCGTYKLPSAEGTMTVKDDVVIGSTLNTAAQQAVVVTGTWNSNNANSVRLDMLFVEIA